MFFFHFIQWICVCVCSGLRVTTGKWQLGKRKKAIREEDEMMRPKSVFICSKHFWDRFMAVASYELKLISN